MEGSFPIYLFPYQQPWSTPYTPAFATTGEPTMDTSPKLMTHSGAHSRRSTFYRSSQMCDICDYCIVLSKFVALNILCSLFKHQTNQSVASNAHIRTKPDFWRVCVPAEDNGGWLICEAGSWLALEAAASCWCFGFLGL